MSTYRMTKDEQIEALSQLVERLQKENEALRKALDSRRDGLPIGASSRKSYTCSIDEARLINLRTVKKMSYAAIAREVGASLQLVRYHLNKYGL